MALSLTFAPKSEVSATYHDARNIMADGIRHYRGYIGECVAGTAVAQQFARKALMLEFPRQFYEQGVIFIHVPKNAGTSLNTVLFGMPQAHRPASFYRKLDPAFYDRTPSFAIVRDPMARAISAYRFFQSGGGSHVKLSWFWQYRARQVQDFDSFLDWIKDLFDAGSSVDFVMRRQADYVTDQAGRVMTTHLFRLEEDQRDLLDFLGRFGVRAVPHLNSTRGPDLKPTFRQRTLVEELYASDYALMAALA